MNNEQQLISAMTGIVKIQEFLVGIGQRESIGQQIFKSENLRQFLAGKQEMAKIEIKTAITSGNGSANNALVYASKPPIDAGARRRLNIRELIPAFATESGAVELPVKGGTNNAAPQAAGSPLQREDVTLGESAFTFTSSYVPVQTIGHFVPVSKQVFEDAGTLDGFIQTEMAHGVQAAVESQILNGTGSTGSLTGLLAGATAWTQPSPNTTSELTILRSAIRQIAIANFTANAIVLNPNDWFDIEVKNSYLAGQPRLAGAPSLFGLPVIESNAIASGTFLVGDFARAAALFVRQGLLVEISKHNSDGFTRGMVTILAQERLALVTANPLALVKGSL